MTTKQTEIAKTQSGGALAVGYDYGTDAGAGFETTTGADLSVPFLSVLQASSPQVEAKDPPGAEGGMIFNTVTRELMDGERGVVFLPVHKEAAYVEWVPRIKGGGFAGLHDPNGDVVRTALAARGDDYTIKPMVGDNELAETYYVYGLLLNDAGDETIGFAVIAFNSTKIKPYRDFVTAMYTIKGRPPMFANRARIRTVRQKNQHGTFFNFRIDPLADTWVKSLINPENQGGLLAEARDFRDMVVSGMARAAFETERSTGGDVAAATVDDENPPF